MIESNLISKILKKNYICFVNLKNLNDYLTNNLKIIREEILTSLNNKVERKFV